MPKEIKRLQDAIRATHGCESKYLASKVITESFEGKTAWKGVVAIFNLVDHPKTKRAYAWTYRDGDQDKTVAVLGVPPVDSPESAVKVAIAAKANAGRLSS